MTDKEIIELRIKCCEVFVASSSLHGLEKGAIFELGERLWQFAVSALERKPQPKSKQ